MNPKRTHSQRQPSLSFSKRQHKPNIDYIYDFHPNYKQDQQQQQEPPIGNFVGRSKYVVTKYLSEGCFGRLYLGIHNETKVEVAIKMERIGCDKPQLFLEYRFYKKLHKLPKGVPKIFTFGPCVHWNALVMELLGPNLEKMLELCGGRFSLRSVIQLTIQFLFLFRGIHECGLLYRDTKPANFLLGLPNTSKWWIVHVVDLGFCKEWRQDDGTHIPYQENKPFTGTVRYMSINNNMGHEQSRRDDLEALAYMLIYFYKGRLPWQGIIAPTLPKRYVLIGECKLSTPIESLCSNMPEEYTRYLQTVRSMSFEERPNYTGLLKPFIELLARDYALEINDKVYDWTLAHDIKSPQLRYMTNIDANMARQSKNKSYSNLYSKNSSNDNNSANLNFQSITPTQFVGGRRGDENNGTSFSLIK